MTQGSKDFRVKQAREASDRMWGLAIGLRVVMGESKDPLIKHMARTLRKTPGYPDPEWDIHRAVKAAAGYAKQPPHPGMDPLLEGQIVAFNRLLEELERMAEEAIKAWEDT